jgi:MoxR-like ATPase
MKLASSFDSRIELTQLKEATDKIRQSSARFVVGQHKMFDLLLTALLADGHVLIEGVPGIAKTLTAKLLSKMIATDFSRIQFTPDLMPSDILGTSVFNMKTSEFDFRKGPLFSNIILIDEINRSPAKTQAALFEVMEERQITIDGKTHAMDALYMVIATQNPIEQEGTYKLPEAQLDRFLFKININYPSRDEETIILERHHSNKNLPKLQGVEPVIKPEEILELRHKIEGVHVEKNLMDYIVSIIEATRNHSALYLGASPRASIAVLNSSKAFAALNGRDFVSPDDIKFVVPPVIDHRIILSPEAEMEGLTTSQVTKRILDKIEVPR